MCVWTNIVNVRSYACIFNCVCFYLYWLYLPKTKVLLGEVYKHSYSCSLILVDLWAEKSNFVCMHLPLLTKQYILGFRNIVFLTIKNRLEKRHDKFDFVIISFRFQWLDSDCSRIQKKGTVLSIILTQLRTWNIFCY